MNLPQVNLEKIKTLVLASPFEKGGLRGIL